MGLLYIYDYIRLFTYAYQEPVSQKWSYQFIRHILCSDFGALKYFFSVFGTNNIIFWCK